MKKREIIAGISSEGFYGFIANNYWRLSKDELKDIALEIIYASYSDIENCLDGDFDCTEQKALYELDERIEDDED